MAVEILSEYGDKLNCHECDDRLKEERGHYKEGIVPFWVDGLQVFRCPLTYITELSWEYIKSYGLFSKGFMPNGIGWMNESNKFIQAMIIIDKKINKQDFKDS